MITNDFDQTFDKLSMLYYIQHTERRADTIRSNQPSKTQLLNLNIHHTIPHWIFKHQDKGKVDGEDTENTFYTTWPPVSCRLCRFPLHW